MLSADPDRSLAEAEQQHQTADNVSVLPLDSAELLLRRDRAAGPALHESWQRLASNCHRKAFRTRSRRAPDKLNSETHEVFPEEDVYRIDHYLGKETVQNILAFRFGNGIFEPLWNRHYIDHVQITAAESIGVEGRGGYYQEAGALRDMIQNHLLQVMATVTMEPPAVFDADERARRARQTAARHPGDEAGGSAVVRGRGPVRAREDRRPGSAGFSSGGRRRSELADRHLRGGYFLRRQLALGRRAVLHSKRKAASEACDGYRHSVQCAAACHVSAGNAAWPARATPQSAGFAHSAGRGHFAALPIEKSGQRNASASGLDGFQLRFEFRRAVPSAYETLLVDAMAGDPTLYTRQDMVEASWQVVQPILDVWQNRSLIFPITKLAHGDRRRRTKCSRARAMFGGFHE